MNDSKSLDLFCIVELFGHQKIAGRCTEQNIAGTNMLRVDVPAVEGMPGFTRLFGSAAIYAINPVDEETCNYFAKQLQVKPIQAWDIREIIKTHNEKMLTGGAPESENDEDDLPY